MAGAALGVLFSVMVSLSWNCVCAIRCWGSSGAALMFLERDLRAFVTQSFPVSAQRSDGHGAE